MRRPIIAGNWKLHKTIAETQSFLDALLPAVRDVDHCDIVVAPPFTALHAAVERVRGMRIRVAAQDVFWERNGAYTGEVSAEMLLDLGCAYTIVGHSERRQLFGETDETVARKVRSALDCGLRPLVCVGETLGEREGGAAIGVVQEQIRKGFSRLTPSDLSHMIVAYEPVWAIGTGKVATPDIAAEMHSAVRSTIASLFGGSIADGVRILYGGSVKADNIRELMAQSEIDGALVGGASLDPASFTAIIRYNS